MRTYDGYRGIWYMNQPQPDPYRFKYSGGFATYPQQHVPLAVYSAEANRTFFCYGGRGDAGNFIANMVSYYDHATGTAPRPVAVVERRTNDTHYNPTLALDARGHVYVFCNSHGQGYQLGADDPTHGRAYIYRSATPYSIADLACVRDDNFSYSQPWPVTGRGMLWLHTRYDGGQRRNFFATSADGVAWSEPRMLSHLHHGSYQVSWARGDCVATALDYHPEPVGLNARTNLYYLQTRDFGETWTTAAGEPVALPLRDPRNPALVHDFQADGLLVYLKDLAFDAEGRPVVLYLTSRGHTAGPVNDPRTWRTARWTGRAWEHRDILTSDHNYDHGSLYIEPDGLWRLIAPTDPGAQPYGTGGEIAIHTSPDEGRTWRRVRALPVGNGRNQTYVRRPLHAHPDFYAFWADGNAFEPSDSDLYGCTRDGAAFRLPRRMSGPTARPESLANGCQIGS